MGAVATLKAIWGHPLNRDGRLKALSRFVRWQIASRLVGEPIALPFVDETRLLVTKGMTGATGNWYCGLLEPGEMAFVLHALRPGELFVDVGANVGVYSVIAAGAVGAEVIAVEPVPVTHDRLQANLRLNRLPHVEAHHCGLADEPGELRFTTDLDCMNRVAMPDETCPTRLVPVETLDRLCNGRAPNMIKIDVEGYELPVLKGAAATLSSPALQAVIMETNGSGGRFGVGDDILFETMGGYGFAPFIYDWRARALSPAPSNAGNVIFVRDADMLSRKCQAAGSHRLVNGTI
jgi:FkbM family methyltransferase